MAKKTINVTERDIKLGKKNHILACPIARALRRKSTNGHVASWATTAHLDGKVFLLPPVAIQFVRKFDAGKKVKPFKFTLTDY